MTSTHVYNQENKKNIHATSTTTHLTPLNVTLPISPVKLHTTKNLPSAGKEYLCFQINDRFSHAAQCVKSQKMNKAIDYFLYIDTFEQQCVVIKGMIQSPRLEDQLKTTGIDQSLHNRAYFEQKC